MESNFWDVAELIGINDTWYRWRGHTRMDDFNEIKTPGIYQIAKDEGTLNAPPIYGLLEILAGPGSTIIQRATESAGRIYYRAFRNSDGTWIPWREL